LDNTCKTLLTNHLLTHDSKQCPNLKIATKVRSHRLCSNHFTATLTGDDIAPTDIIITTAETTDTLTTILKLTETLPTAANNLTKPNGLRMAQKTVNKKSLTS
jgi:hypothetical protein